MPQSKEQKKKKKKLRKRTKQNGHKQPTHQCKVIKMLAELERRMDEHSEADNKEMENIRRQQKEVITELKNSKN